MTVASIVAIENDPLMVDEENDESLLGGISEEENDVASNYAKQTAEVNNLAEASLSLESLYRDLTSIVKVPETINPAGIRLINYTAESFTENLGNSTSMLVSNPLVNHKAFARDPKLAYELTLENYGQLARDIFKAFIEGLMRVYQFIVKRLTFNGTRDNETERRAKENSEAYKTAVSDAELRAAWEQATQVTRDIDVPIYISRALWNTKTGRFIKDWNEVTSTTDYLTRSIIGTYIPALEAELNDYVRFFEGRLTNLIKNGKSGQPINKLVSDTLANVNKNAIEIRKKHLSTAVTNISRLLSNGSVGGITVVADPEYKLGLTINYQGPHQREERTTADNLPTEGIKISDPTPFTKNPHIDFGAKRALTSTIQRYVELSQQMIKRLDKMMQDADKAFRGQQTVGTFVNTIAQAIAKDAAKNAQSLRNYDSYVSDTNKAIVDLNRIAYRRIKQATSKDTIRLNK